MGVKQRHVDPLFELFEHFLVTRSFEDSAAFARQLAEKYVAYLDSTPAHVPFENRATLLEDLETEIQEMLVKKMYGCARVDDYLDCGAVVTMQAGTVLPFRLITTGTDESAEPYGPVKD